MALVRHGSLEIEFSRRESRLIWSISQSFHRSSALFCPARCPSYKLSIYLLDAVRAIMLPYTSKYGWNLETLTLQPQWSQYGVCHNLAKVFLKSYHNFECSITSIIQEILNALNVFIFLFKDMTLLWNGLKTRSILRKWIKNRTSIIKLDFFLDWKLSNVFIPSKDR